MNIEAVSEMDSIESVAWETETIAQWNGRDLNAIHGKHHEDRISSVALQRARFDNAQTGYILCKNERDSSSKSESRSSNDKSSNSDSKKSDDKESKTEVKNSVSVGGKYDRDNHGHSYQEMHLKHTTVIKFKNGNTLEFSAEGGVDRHVNGNQISDRTSGEIDASYNY